MEEIRGEWRCIGRVRDAGRSEEEIRRKTIEESLRKKKK
jgi:hypothetical protein